MSLCLLLTACAVGANPAPIPPSGWYPVAGYATATDAPPAYPGGYVAYPPVMPMQPYWGVMPVGGCAGGNCGPAGCGAPACAPMCAPTCDDCAPRKKLFSCFRKRNDCCEEPCGQPDYKAAAQCCKAMADSCCCKEPRCGLLARLRNCFKKRDRGCCPPPDCNTCCKPSLRDRLKKCFAKDDCCEQTCCKPSLHERLRAAFRKCKKCDDCGCSASASPAGKPEPINPPKEMPKEAPKDAVRGPLPKGPPIQVISEVPF